MSTLFSSLQTASKALDIYSRLLGNEETNVSNASTDGFAALRSRVSPIGPNGSPPGVDDYITVTTAGDAHADALVRAASAQASASQMLADQLTPVNGVFDITGATGILAAFQNFTSAFGKLSVTPNDSTLQALAINSTTSVASEFRKAASQISRQRATADTDIAAVIARINELSVQIRQFNVQIRGGASPASGVDAGMRSALDELASLIDVGVTNNTDGTISVLAGGQQPLVLGDQVYRLSGDPAQSPGQQIVSSGGGGSPSVYGGKLGALLDFRNNTVAELIGGNGITGTLNELAKGFATRVNTLLTSGVTGAGTPGTAIFQWDFANDIHAADTLSISSGFTPAQLATGTTGASNGVSDALAKLIASNQPADQINGRSAQDLFSGIAASVGVQLSHARELSGTNQTALVSAQSVRRSVSAVSLDQAAVAITAYQRAWQANAKVVSIINELTSDVINLIK